MKIFFVTRREMVSYDVRKHSFQIWNFLYWENENVLIAGDGQYGLENGSHKNLHKCAMSHNPNVQRRVPDGAGNCMGRERKVIGWKSDGYKVVTAISLRVSILEALGFVEGCD